MTQAIIHRKETCPYGKKAVALLNEKGFEIEDHILSSSEEVDAFKEKHGVTTTPQVFIEGKRVGGHSDLLTHFGEEETIQDQKSEPSYRPVIAVFSTTLLLAMFTSSGMMGFMGYSLCALAMLKLMNLDSFSASFKNYDLISQKFPAYGKVYPFAELFAGLGFVSGSMTFLTGLVAAFVGITGGYSIYKAVYVDKKDLNCACVGGGSNVPLGPVSFTENAMMAVMGLALLL